MARIRESDGIRPSPLKIDKDTNLMKKPTILSAITTTTTTTLSSVSSASQRQPIIIYTHSPKIIHIEACDFMAVVQKLTGFSASSIDGNYHNSIPPSPNNEDIPISTKRRKISIGKKKESIKSSTDGTLQLVPQQWPSIEPMMADFEFMQGYASVL